MAYRLAHGLRDEDVDMAVLITAMIDARCGGVAYSTDPAGSSEVPAGSGAGRVLVHAVPGLPKAVVDGSLDVDRFELDRATLEVAHVHVAHKTARLAVDAGAGVREESLDESLADAPCLSAAEARAVARLALELERHFGCPQDVEWALDRAGVLYLLQCRPLQVRAAREARAAAPSGAVAGALALGGVAASPGAACGPVFVLRKQADALRFPQGAVLVTAQALPGWAPLLAKAAAVVTEHGSQAGHLATVAREYGVPALMGLEDACALLADAGEVTVDADRLAVLPGRDEAALARSRPRSAGLMAGSAVHEALRRAAEHVVPLRLLDPDGPDFRPENCRTLHDVTRYCHEKAVHAMFHKGGDVAFPQGASRRLSCGGKTMQYWIIDLQDGLDEAGRDRRTVRLEDVRSVPMLALWRGMTAVQWAGPPAVDAKGFMSVVVEASMNPDLDPAMGSPMAMRNYFMISRDFMSLQSRFGFHFCSVEAVIGERDEQNFACFQFKGGAASMERRVARAALVGEVMAEHGFLTEVRADNLYARIEHLPAARMEDALAILGHLIVHTRQLDMVMGSPERARAEADKLRADLAAVLGGTAP
jgi:pyruvate,water dikinase